MKKTKSSQGSSGSSREKVNSCKILWAKEAKRARDKKWRAKQFEDLCEYAWGIIANAGGSDWTKENKMWQIAAIKWRKKYFHLLSTHLPAPKSKNKPN